MAGVLGATAAIFARRCLRDDESTRVSYVESLSDGNPGRHIVDKLKDKDEAPRERDLTQEKDYAHRARSATYVNWARVHGRLRWGLV